MTPVVVIGLDVVTGAGAVVVSFEFVAGTADDVVVVMTLVVASEVEDD